MNFFKLLRVAITDTNFNQSLGIQISRIFYMASLVWHALVAVGGLITGLYFGITMLLPRTYGSFGYVFTAPGNPLGILVVLATLVIVPVVTVLGVLVSRYSYEWYNAVIHTAENTKRQH